MFTVKSEQATAEGHKKEFVCPCYPVSTEASIINCTANKPDSDLFYIFTWEVWIK